MALDSRAQAALALHRFGLGPRAGSIAAIASDPRGALIAELDPPAPADRRCGSAGQWLGVPRGSATSCRRDGRCASRPMPTIRRPATEKRATKDAQPRNAASRRHRVRRRSNPPPIYHDEAQARLAAALGADIGFAERLVWFWSNHFCVSADKSRCGRSPAPSSAKRSAPCARPLWRHAAGGGEPPGDAVLSRQCAFDRSEFARRPQPPARTQRESRARNPRTAYARRAQRLYAAGCHQLRQGDHRLDHLPGRQDPERGGEFVFNHRMHEPGAQTVLGKSLRDSGVEQGRAVLADLARHPATARHVASKLARHFVAESRSAPGRAPGERFLETEAT